MALRKQVAKAEPGPDLVTVLQAKMQRYWGGLTNHDLQLLPEISADLRSLRLSSEVLGQLNGWLVGGQGEAGERRSNLRELVKNEAST